MDTKADVDKAAEPSRTEVGGANTNAGTPGGSEPTTTAGPGVANAEEASWIARAGAGDRRALEALLQKYGPLLYRSVLLPRLGDETRARDALSETYAKVVTSIGRFRDQGVGIYPWLRTIAVHAAIDQLRSRKRETPFDAEFLERELDQGETSCSTDVTLIEVEEATRVRRRLEDALGALNPRYAQAIRWRVLEERPREEVASLLGTSTATFDVVLHRAMNALRKALQSSSGVDDDTR